MSFTPRKITRTEIDGDSGDEIEREIPFMKGYTVFNVEQVEGLPAQYYAKAEPRLDTVQRIDRAESFFAATGATISHGGNQAFYTMAAGPGADAAVRELSGRRELLRHAGP